MTRTLIALTTLTGTLFVASALAQNSPSLPRAGNDPNVLYTVPPPPEHELVTETPNFNFFYTPGIRTGPSENPAVRKLGTAEVELAQSAATLSKQLTGADSDSKRDEIKAKLGEVLGKQFDVRQQRHKLQIENLEEQVKKLKDLVRRRQEGRGDIISRRLEQMVRESEGLGW